MAERFHFDWKLRVTTLQFLSAMHFATWVGIHSANLQTLYLIYEIAIQSCVFVYCILDLPTYIDLWNLYYSFLAGNEVVSSLFDCEGKCGNAWKLDNNYGLWIPRKKAENSLAEIYSLRNLYIIYYISKNIFYLWIPTLLVQFSPNVNVIQ
jgi:hypothetical protein